jgi:Tol biopolymer transport system component
LAEPGEQRGLGGEDELSARVGAALSADGTRVAFASYATNLDPADTDGGSDVYVKDLTTGDIVLASTSDTGAKGNGWAPAFSDDGTRMAFVSSATNLDPSDTQTGPDIYVKDLTTGDITLASTSDAGVKGNFQSHGPSLSYDGTRVAFWSRATSLDPADTDTLPDVYVKNLLASTSDTGVKGHGSDPALSDDGTKVAFESFNLDPADTDSEGDVYVKDLTTGDTVFASTSDAGDNSNYHSSYPAISGDATRVLFRTFSTNLDLADSESYDADAYVKDLASGDLTLASASDTGVSDDGGVALRSSFSADGSRVAFSSTDTQLDPGDTDTNSDVYVKEMPSVPTSIAIDECSNGQIGTASVVEAPPTARGRSGVPPHSEVQRPTTIQTRRPCWSA